MRTDFVFLMLITTFTPACGKLAESIPEDQTAYADGGATSVDATAADAAPSCMAATGTNPCTALTLSGPPVQVQDEAGSPLPAQAPWDGGYAFFGLEEFFTFFRSLAQANAYVDPVRQIDCSADAPASACTYDPRSPRSSPTDIRYSDDLNRFVGPDGHNYVWSYGFNWFLGDLAVSPLTYNTLLQCNCVEAPDGSH
jgi:hypothetical protein